EHRLQRQRRGRGPGLRGRPPRGGRRTRDRRRRARDPAGAPGGGRAHVAPHGEVGLGGAGGRRAVGAAPSRGGRVGRLRFGAPARVAHSREEWLEKARRAEALGYAVFLVPDHFRDQVATSVGLMAAADATTTIRVGSMVYDNDFRHPAVVAKDAATLDLLSGGRFELGLGAGWLLGDYATTRMRFDARRGRSRATAVAARLITHDTALN